MWWITSANVQCWASLLFEGMFEWWYFLLKISYKASISLIAAPLWIFWGTKAQMCHAWQTGLYLHTWVTLAWNRMILIIDYMLFFCCVFHCFRACPHLLCIMSRRSSCVRVFALETRRCYLHQGGIFSIFLCTQVLKSFDVPWNTYFSKSEDLYHFNLKLNHYCFNCFFLFITLQLF